MHLFFNKSINAFLLVFGTGQDTSLIDTQIVIDWKKIIRIICEFIIIIHINKYIDTHQVH
jgi:hypothetical protein